MMEYKFDEEKFIESFNAKSSEKKSADSMRLTHKADNLFKLFPYKASGKTQAPIVTDLEDVVSGFFREALNKKTEPIDYEDLCTSLLDEVEIEPMPPPSCCLQDAWLGHLLCLGFDNFWLKVNFIQY